MGTDLTAATPRAIVRAGIVEVLEGQRVFTTVSVEDNFCGDRTKLERVYAMFPEMAERREQIASCLSGGQQQIL